ncbi:MULTISPECIES: GntR family transcriptional regulator [Paracoccus]|jgi:DNA-binding GntR family transcriptional regulator|uniref:GntR family transcriptional regulator n=1 Tax=Paracoccus TaxID=265 RepID=UPI001E42D4BA|nr:MULTISPECIES: GntR family transcriptional regulator [Paracoccus]UFS67455.1 GntR family transcriptional regulator [Paracoccus denitrificans]
MSISSNLSQEAHRRIIGMIFEGALKSGDALQEAPLGERLGMSRTPVREAIKRIESEGLAETSGRFTRVRHMRRSEFEEIFFLRLQLEPFAARAAVRLPPAQVDAMEERIRRLMAAGPELDGSHFQTDNDFHDMMLQPLGNRTISAVVASLRRRTCVFDHTQVPDRFLQGCDEHLEILNAVRSGNADAVATGMVRHLENARDAVLDRLDRISAETAP